MFRNWFSAWWRNGASDLLEPPRPGWWRVLPPDKFEYLYSTSEQRLQELLALAYQQEQRVALVITWAFALITASHLFGALDPGADAIGIASWAALSATALIVAFGYLFIFPRDWDVGIDVVWLSRYDAATAAVLRGEALETMVNAYYQNRRTMSDRQKWNALMRIELAIQGIAVLVVIVLATR